MRESFTTPPKASLSMHPTAHVENSCPIINTIYTHYVEPHFTHFFKQKVKPIKSYGISLGLNHPILEKKNHHNLQYG